jgi:hypothetical protein
VCAGLSHGCLESKFYDIRYTGPANQRGFFIDPLFISKVKEQQMFQRVQPAIPVHNPEHRIAKEGYVQLCPAIKVGLGLWATASFESKTNYSRLRSVVWQQ